MAGNGDDKLLTGVEDGGMVAEWKRFCPLNGNFFVGLMGWWGRVELDQTKEELKTWK